MLETCSLTILLNAKAYTVLNLKLRPILILFLNESIHFIIFLLVLYYFTDGVHIVIQLFVNYCGRTLCEH